jgi:hypothetical protein
MTAQQAGVWTRRAFLRGLVLAGAAGVLGVYPRQVAAVEAPHTSAQVDTSSALGVCPPRDAICPNCCHYSDEAT